MLRTLPFLLIAGAAFAQDVIIDEIPPDWQRPQRWGMPVLDVTDYTVEATVRDQAADVTINATFRNPSAGIAEGHFLMNLPGEASAEDFAMTLNGVEMAPELLDANQARQVYEDYVRRFIDPGLLELSGDGLLRARVFPIPANGEVQIRVRFRAILERLGNTVELRLPLARYREGNEPIGRVQANVTIASSNAIGNVYSPSHALSVARADANSVHVSFEEQGYTEHRDLTIYYGVSEDAVGMTMLTYQPTDEEDGYFMLLASPRVDLPEDHVLPRDFIFAVDRSGSMRGDKFHQAVEAVAYCIENLREIDRFNIVDYASDARSFQSALVDVTEDNRNRALRYLDEMRPGGGTNIESALRTALGMFASSDERLPMLFFATDGLPTVGVRDFGELLGIARGQNQADVRLFALGVGTDVNTFLLDRMAEDGNGARDYILPEESIEERVSLLYNKTSSPVLMNVQFDSGAIEAFEVYPQRMRDLYRGDQMVLVGRFHESAPAAITLTGSAGGEPVTYQIEIPAPTADASLDFLPRLWAGRKVNWLVDQVRMSESPDQEVVEEIVELARRYGIVTPYTSYLILEDDLPQPQMWRAREELEALRGRAFGSGGADEGATQDAIEESRRLAEAQNAPAPAAEPGENADRILGRNAEELVRYAGARTFYNRDGVWTDSTFDTETPADRITVITAGSDEYLALLREHPEAARMIVGLPVILVLDGQVYRVNAPEN